MGQDQKAKTEHYEEIEDYDYNNPNDTSNFCPGLQVRGEELLPFPNGGVVSFLVSTVPSECKQL